MEKYLPTTKVASEKNFSPVYTHLMHVQAFALVVSHALDISQHSLKEWSIIWLKWNLHIQYIALKEYRNSSLPKPQNEKYTWKKKKRQIELSVHEFTSFGWKPVQF